MDNIELEVIQKGLESKKQQAIKAGIIYERARKMEIKIVKEYGFSVVRFEDVQKKGRGLNRANAIYRADVARNYSAGIPIKTRPPMI